MICKYVVVGSLLLGVTKSPTGQQVAFLSGNTSTTAAGGPRADPTLAPRPRPVQSAEFQLMCEGPVLAVTTVSGHSVKP